MFRNPVTPFWDRSQGVVILSFSGDDLPDRAGSVVVQVSDDHDGGAARFLGEIRLARPEHRARGSVVNMLTGDVLMVRPGRNPPFTLHLSIFTGAEQLETWQQLTFVDDGGIEAREEPHVAVLFTEHRGAHSDEPLWPAHHPARLEEHRHQASAIGATHLYAARLLGGDYGPAKFFPPAATTLDAWAVAVRDGRQHGPQEGPESGPREWLEINVDAGPPGTDPWPIRRMLQFGMIRNRKRDHESERIEPLPDSYVKVGTVPSGPGQGRPFVRARFLDLAHLDRAFVAAHQGFQLRSYGEDEPARALAYVFCGVSPAGPDDQAALRDTGVLPGSELATEQVAERWLTDIDSRDAPVVPPLSRLYAGIFRQQLACEDQEAVRDLVASATFFGLSTDRDEDVIHHTDLLNALQWEGSRARVLAVLRKGTGPRLQETGPMAVVREVLTREMPALAGRLDPWLADADNPHWQVWQAFRRGHLPLAPFVKAGAPISESPEVVARVLDFLDAQERPGFREAVNRLLSPQEKPWGRGAPGAPPPFRQLRAAQEAYERVEPAVSQALAETLRRDVPRLHTALRREGIPGADPRADVEALGALAARAGAEEPLMDEAEAALLRQQDGVWLLLRPALTTLLQRAQAFEQQLQREALERRRRLLEQRGITIDSMEQLQLLLQYAPMTRQERFDALWMTVSERTVSDAMLNAEIARLHELLAPGQVSRAVEQLGGEVKMLLANTYAELRQERITLPDDINLAPEIFNRRTADRALRWLQAHYWRWHWPKLTRQERDLVWQLLHPPGEDPPQDDAL